MKRYAKTLQVDARGQIVIPKEVREALGIGEGTAFFAYLIPDEGLFLKKIPEHDLSSSKELTDLKTNAKKIGVQKKNVEQAENEYKKEPRGGITDV